MLCYGLLDVAYLLNESYILRTMFSRRKPRQFLHCHSILQNLVEDVSVEEVQRFSTYSLRHRFRLRSRCFKYKLCIVFDEVLNSRTDQSRLELKFYTIDTTETTKKTLKITHKRRFRGVNTVLKGDNGELIM